MIWTEFKLFFTLPKIIIALFLVLFNYQILKLNSNTINITYLIILTTFLIVLPLIKIFIDRKKLKKEIAKTGKKLMAHVLIAGVGNFGIYSQITLQLLLKLGGEENQNLHKYAIIFSLFITSLCLITYISIFVIPKQIQKKIAQNDSSFL